MTKVAKMPPVAATTSPLPAEFDAEREAGVRYIDATTRRRANAGGP